MGGPQGKHLGDALRQKPGRGRLQGSTRLAVQSERGANSAATQTTSYQ